MKARSQKTVIIVRSSILSKFFQFKSNLNVKSNTTKDMEDILKTLQIKPNRKSIKMVTNFCYKEGVGVGKFKDILSTIKLEPPKVRPPPPPRTPTQVSVTSAGNFQFPPQVPQPGNTLHLPFLF